MTRLFSLTVLLVSSVAYAQTSAPANTATTAKPLNTATAPTTSSSDGKLRYEVIKVHGKVMVAPTDADIGAAAWKPVRKGQLIGAGLKVSVGFRGGLKLIANPNTPPTVVMIERSSLVDINELAMKNGVATARLGLGYGAIRAGVVEGGTRSDMEITCPVATLSKRGTDIFRIEYRPGGRFFMSLSDQGRGQLQALQFKIGQSGRLLSSRSRFLGPGQRVSHDLIQAIQNAVFDNPINIGDLYGLKGNDLLFTLLNDRGLSFLLPQGRDLANWPRGNNLLPDVGADESNPFTGPATSVAQNRRDGDFGIGQGPVPGISTHLNTANGPSQRGLFQTRQNCNAFNRTRCKQQHRPRR